MQVQPTSYLPIELTKNEILEKAANIISESFHQSEAFTSPTKVREYLSYKLHQHEREVFAVLLLNAQHQLIEYKELFFGTINAASVYPREVVKLALIQNAAAVIFAHNHPSGLAEPSEADIRITKCLKEALAIIDIQVLDHFVVGAKVVSMAERGMI